MDTYHTQLSVDRVYDVLISVVHVEPLCTYSVTSLIILKQYNTKFIHVISYRRNYRHYAASQPLMRKILVLSFTRTFLTVFLNHFISNVLHCYEYNDKHSSCLHTMRKSISNYVTILSMLHNTAINKAW